MEDSSNSRDFSSISISARWLILLKGHTTIPFARAAAELLEYPKEYVPDFKKKDYTFWASTMGLERRYRSIDQLLNDLPIKNIMELSSGYSFRGLEYARQKGVHFIDTDLPDLIAVKKEFVRSLKKEDSSSEGILEVLPLNVLDESSFREIISHFPLGEIAIINEGLLGYLTRPEKEKLCAIIHDILTERGGYWITADICLKNKEQRLGLKYSDEIKEFNEQQDTEGKSFESVEEAEMFFKEMGFVIDKVSDLKYSEMSSFKYFRKSLTLRNLLKMKGAGSVFSTWRLKAV
jgi:O-methyltransferase involved in polyketide biosynthesis